MDILKAEIALKRKQLETKQLIGPNKRQFKREDLIRAEEEEYWKRHKQAEQEANSGTTSGVEAASSRVRDASARDSDAKKPEDIIFARKEVIKRLRERNEPIVLFGESEHDAFVRLKHLELINPDHTKGQVNDFQQAMEQVDQAYLNEILKSDHKSDEAKKKLHDVKVDESGTTYEELREKARQLGCRKEAKAEDAKFVGKFLKFLLEIWGRSLNDRPEEVKASTAGKIACATYSQTQAYLKPLFKQLARNKLIDDITTHLIHIVRNVLERDYVKANDAYLQMAIGNAPWPIGVTMVGIHARTGREKIFAQNIAHVLNDETQRKYIQGIKRLITQCQRSFPTDPSKCVEYKAIE
jgi:pre-mRNA-splicing factor 18